MTFGGRAAEDLIFNKISTGAQSDLDQVTKMSYSMITVFGMNKKVGQVSFYGMSQEGYQRPYSDNTATLIDDEVRKLLDSQYLRAKALLTSRRKELEIVAKALLEKEVILKSDLLKLIGPRPYDFEPNPNPLSPVADAPIVENGTSKLHREEESDEEEQA
jgi:cell division protease FtsH